MELILCMYQNSWNTGKVALAESGFSVSKDIMAMREKGFLGQALTKP